MRPQGQDIIRTWAFYTIAKALLHEDSVPWRHIAMSGFITDPDRKKMSKSKGNVVTPLPLLDEYTADGVRYWAASARLGVDTALDEKVFKVGKRLVTKIFNAGKFALAQEAEVGPISSELDRAFAAKLRALALRATRNFESFHHAPVLQEAESFFWTHFTDTYLELAKRARAARIRRGPAERGSAVATLRLGLGVLLRLFAPFLPYITEEVWSWAFAAEKRPAVDPRRAVAQRGGLRGRSGARRARELRPRGGVLERDPQGEGRRGRVDGTRGGAALDRGATRRRSHAAGVLGDVLAAARCRAHVLATDDTLGDGELAIRDAVFAERAEE